MYAKVWTKTFTLLLNLQSVTLHTDLGDLKIEIFCEDTPKASEVRLFYYPPSRRIDFDRINERIKDVR